MRRPLVDGVDGPSFAPQVFHEAMHDDARTNIAIALTAAEKGAAVANYCEVTSLLKDEGGRAEGVSVLDRVTNQRFDVRAKAVVFCGGPYTDALRKLGDEGAEDAVAGASGTHVVLPGYYCPRDQGLLDYNTSDGRFLFFLPWLGHTLVGTTDAPSAAETRPTAPEDEVQWLLNECSRYLSPDVRVSRKDVLSAWRGWSRRGVPPRVRTERARASENSNGVGRAGDPSRATLMQRPARPRRATMSSRGTRRRASSSRQEASGRRGARWPRNWLMRSWAASTSTQSRARPPRSASWVETGGSRR